MDLWNKIQLKRAIKAETDTRTEYKGVGRLGCATSPPPDGDPAGTKSAADRSSRDSRETFFLLA